MEKSVRLFICAKTEKGEYNMRIEKSKVVLDGHYKNVLVKEYFRNYPCLDKLANPADITQVMAYRP